jgi:hypothetical protein
MSRVGYSEHHILGPERLMRVVAHAREMLEKNPGPGYLRVVVDDDRSECAYVYVPRSEFEEAPPEPNPDAPEAYFRRQFERAIEECDHARAVVCQLRHGPAVQLVTVEKPWLAEASADSALMREMAEALQGAEGGELRRAVEQVLERLLKHVVALMPDVCEVGRAAAVQELRALFTERGVPASHGLAHAEAVGAHARQAVRSYFKAARARPGAVSQALERIGAIEAGPGWADAAAQCCAEAADDQLVKDIIAAMAAGLAALLHDADDRKYFDRPADGPALPNAERILGAALAEVEVDAAGLDVLGLGGGGFVEKVRACALEAIGYVSASGNGNDAPLRAAENPLLLYPRWADRLEALGETGVERCWAYTEEVGRPLYDDESPPPAPADEAMRLATPERLAAYRARGESRTMIDHYYDKLLHLAAPLRAHENEYFREAAAGRLEPLLEVCAAERPDGLLRRLELARARAREDGA